MSLNYINELVEKQRKFFKSNKTLPIDFRINYLKKLKNIINKYEKDIASALYNDLGKSDYESYMCEIGLALSEITYMIKHIKRFSKIKKVHTPLAQFAAKSYISPTPYGNVLIISPWNYPFLLTIEPLVDALAAGNTVIIKPSEYSPHTSEIIDKILSECFPLAYVAVVQGAIEESSTLLKEKFDFIFFTGNQNVGKVILHNAAENLTPTVLELGGKSPCIVDDTAKIELAAKRIVFGKFLNCGQTCVAPDFILCHTSIKAKLVNELINQIKIQYSNTPISYDKYGKIITNRHFSRLINLIDKSKIVFGGNYDITTLKIEPTILDNVSWEDKIMQEEIFGPILPILTYENIDDIYEVLSNKPKPLALYMFTESKKNKKKIMDKLIFGGGCVNDTVIHLATTEMGFGGVGESGMGKYHGKAGFDTFSHSKSIVDKKTWIDLPIRYQPYKKGLFEKLIHKFLK